MLTDIQAIVLAPGYSVHEKTKINIMEKICGQELLTYPLRAMDTLAIPVTFCAYSENKEIKNIVELLHAQNSTYRELGSPDNIQFIQNFRSLIHAPHILIMNASIPLISSTLIQEIYEKHITTKAAVTFFAAHCDNPSDQSYNRVIKKNKHISLEKQETLTPQELQKNCCVATDIYVISRNFLLQYLDQAAHSLAHGLQLADLVTFATQEKKQISMVIAPFDYVRTIHTYQELWATEQIKRAELIRYWMERGVRFSAAQSVHLDLDVEIGTGTFIGCGVHILNGTKIGKNAVINPFCLLEHAMLGDYVTIHSHSIIRHSKIGDHAQVGPFAHLQINTTIGNQTIIGNFVEIKQTTIGNQSKAKHLTYLGNAEIGSHVNIGAGTITCNYDGKTKHTTTIEDNVFIGSNNSLVAPITIQKEAFTAAGSTITQDVPSQALAIARAQQVNKEGYARTLHESRSSSDDSKKQPLSFKGAVKSHDSIVDQ